MRRLAVEEGLEEEALSAVCLDGTAERLPISRAYTWFVRDHARRLSGRAAYRLDLDGRIDGGASWMLGAWVAHALLAEEQLAMGPGAADAAVFATGELALSAGAERRAEIRAVAGTARKIARLADAAGREADAGRRALFLAPAENADEAREALARLPEPHRNRIEFLPVADAAEIRALLFPGRAAQRARRALGRRPWGRSAAAVLALCIAAGATASCWLSWRGAEREWDALRNEGRHIELARALDRFVPAFLAERYRARMRRSVAAAPPLSISVAARRPADGGSCAGLRFRGAAVAEANVAPAPGPVYRLDRLRSLCGFSVHAESGGGRVAMSLRLAAGAGARAALLPETQDAEGPSAALATELPLYLDGSWALRLTVVWTPGFSPDAARLAAGGAALAEPEAAGVRIERARIVLAPYAGAAGQ